MTQASKANDLALKLIDVGFDQDMLELLSEIELLCLTRFQESGYEFIQVNFALDEGNFGTDMPVIFDRIRTNCTPIAQLEGKDQKGKICFNVIVAGKPDNITDLKNFFEDKAYNSGIINLP
ncbi:MAG: hypothetical protein WC460_06060 [Patescibacteria group bacterium]